MPSESLAGAARIPLHRRDGAVAAYAIVDEQDHEWLAAAPWCLDSDGYAIRAVYRPVRRLLRMHREVLGLEHGDPDVDHINGDKLDNRRSNLRLATNSLNQQNVGLQARNTSGYRGVNFHRGQQRWQARASLNGKRIWLGAYQTAEEANAVASAFRAEHMPFSREAAERNG